MKTQIKEKATNYREEAMTKQFCLICGERIGDYSYLGKPVCPECLEYIRTNY